MPAVSVFGDNLIEVHHDEHVVVADGRELPLTETEYALTDLLGRNRDRYLGKSRICMELWGYADALTQANMLSRLSHLRGYLPENLKGVFHTKRAIGSTALCHLGPERKLAPEIEALTRMFRGGDLEINAPHWLVRAFGKPVDDISQTEFRLLSLLASQPGRLYSYEGVESMIWGRHGAKANLRRRISTLRSKLGPELGHPMTGIIQTVPSQGYRLNEADY